MPKESIECLAAGCANCQNCNVVKNPKNNITVNLYFCSFFPLLHKASIGKFCSDFKCKTQDTKDLCRYCRRIKRK